MVYASDGLFVYAVYVWQVAADAVSAIDRMECTVNDVSDWRGCAPPWLQCIVL